MVEWRYTDMSTEGYFWYERYWLKEPYLNVVRFVVTPNVWYVVHEPNTHGPGGRPIAGPFESAEAAKVAALFYLDERS